MEKSVSARVTQEKATTVIKHAVNEVQKWEVADKTFLKILFSEATDFQVTPWSLHGGKSDKSLRGQVLIHITSAVTWSLRVVEIICLDFFSMKMKTKNLHCISFYVFFSVKLAIFWTFSFYFCIRIEKSAVVWFFNLCRKPHDILGKGIQLVTSFLVPHKSINILIHFNTATGTK